MRGSWRSRPGRGIGPRGYPKQKCPEIGGAFLFRAGMRAASVPIPGKGKRNSGELDSAYAKWTVLTGRAYGLGAEVSGVDAAGTWPPAKKACVLRVTDPIRAELSAQFRAARDWESATTRM